MGIVEKWITNRGVRLHALESVPPEASAQTPLLIIPGVFGNAEDYVDEMSRLAPRRCLAVSLHGRGHSDVPATGYALEHHVADVAAAVVQSGFERPAIMGYAIGEPTGLRMRLVRRRVSPR